jgi:hypothetical protein
MGLKRRVGAAFGAGRPIKNGTINNCLAQKPDKTQEHFTDDVPTSQYPPVRSTDRPLPTARRHP